MRARHVMRADLDRLFNPRSIAVIGASQDLSTISGQPLKFLHGHGYPGTLYPVNPRYTDILGIRCYPSIADLPETPDLALILVNAARVAGVLEQCGEKRIPFAIIFSSGFAEMAGAGAERQRELAGIARRHGIGVIGPNCQGMINVAGSVFAGFGSVFNFDYEPGAVSMVSQSGGFGFSVMNLAAKDGGLPVRQIVTTGNEIGVSVPDILRHYVRDPGTEVIVAYVEGLRNARGLLDVGEEALLAGKPILMWKAGVTAHGQKAGLAHTANPAGSIPLYRAAMASRGIVQVEDIQDVVDYGRALQCGKLPRGNRLAIVTISGGGGILMTDECIARGMELPALAPATLERLRGFVPEFGSLLNPIDVTASIFNQTDLVGLALDAVLGDPDVDCVAMINASLQGELAVKVAAQIVEAAAKSDKPLFLAWSARDAVSVEPYGMLDRARIPHYRSPVRCGRAIAALAWYAEARRRRERERGERPMMLKSDHARAMLSGGGRVVSGSAALQLLAEYGIGAGDAQRARGVIEVSLAAVNDAHFGPALRLSLGGAIGAAIDSEVCRIAPVTTSAANEMIDGMPGGRQFFGADARRCADRAALADIIVRLSALALDLGDRLAEARIDRLAVLPAGQGCRIAGARVRADSGDRGPEARDQG